MSNEKVILQFLDKRAGHTPTRDITNGVYVYKGQTLKTNGLELINYNTIIAFWEDGKVHLNTHKYSTTTSKIQSKIRQLCKSKGCDIIEYNI